MDAERRPSSHKSTAFEETELIEIHMFNITCLVRATPSRRALNWRSGRGALDGHHPQQTKPPARLDRPAESRR